MKSYRAFVVYNGGMHAGRLFLTDEAVLFQSKKRTLPACVKHQTFPYETIKKITTSRYHFVFPKTELVTPRGLKKFVVINRRSFIKELSIRKGH